MRRRHFEAFLFGISASPLMTQAQGQRQDSLSGNKPVWLGFGLNGSANQQRFALTRDYVQKIKGQSDLTSASAFDWYREPLNQIIKADSKVSFQYKNDIEIGQDLLAGFAHDYETIVACRLEKNGQNANQVLVFMSGVGLILGYERSSGWRIVSSFPFMMRYEFLENDLSSYREKTIRRWRDIYTNYGKAYANYYEQYANRDGKYSSNYFARLTSVEIHKHAATKLKAIGIDKFFSRELLGFSASSSICENLKIPLLPFQENDALSKRYSVRFVEDLKVQDGVAIPDADLRFEVVLRDIEKELIPNMQKGITTIRRLLVLNFKIFAVDFNSGVPVQLFQTITYADPDDDKIPFDSKEDDVPDRDIVFFDRLLTRTLGYLLKGIKQNSADLLAKANVRHEKVASTIPKIMELCSKTL